MNLADRKILAVCASWEDVENLNLMLNRLIEATEGRGILPVCVAFDRSGVESRGEESLLEFMHAFELPNLAGFMLLGEMIRTDAINQHIIDFAQKKGCRYSCWSARMKAALIWPLPTGTALSRLPAI